MAGRPEDKTLALFENTIAAAVGIRERAWLAANILLDDRVAAMRELAEIHEYAEWLRKEILNAKRSWQEKGQPSII